MRMLNVRLGRWSALIALLLSVSYCAPPTDRHDEDGGSGGDTAGGATGSGADAGANGGGGNGTASGGKSSVKPDGGTSSAGGDSSGGNNTGGGLQAGGSGGNLDGSGGNSGDNGGSSGAANTGGSGGGSGSSGGNSGGSGGGSGGSGGSTGGSGGSGGSTGGSGGTISASQPDVCVPSAIGVPGMDLQGPDWWSPTCTTPTCAVPQGRPTTDDPRWAGAMRQSYPAAAPGGASSQADIRTLAEGTTLFVSFQTHVDPTGTGANDAIYLALAKTGADCTDDNATTECARLIRVKLETPNGGSATASTLNSDRSITEYRAFEYNGDWDSIVPSGQFQHVAVWVNHDPSGGAIRPGSWTVELQVDIAALSLGTDFKVWAGVLVQHVTGSIGASYVRYTLPLGTPGAIGSGTGAPPTTLTPVPETGYADVRLGDLTSCSTGISINASQIGVLSGGSLEGAISMQATNTFAARPTYNGVSSSTAGKVKAEFRLANWGSVAASDAAWGWIVASDVPNKGGTGPDSGDIEWDCIQAAGSNQCPQLPSAGVDAHQCMLVTLSSTTAGVTFLRDSAWRNMDFVTASRFHRDAIIDIAGIPAHPEKHPWRDVYLYVRTVNMPGTTERPLSQTALEEALQAADQSEKPRDQSEVKLALVSRRDGETKPPNLTKLPPVRTATATLDSVWPTYEVHAFYDTGEVTQLGKKNAKRLEPMLPFGYRVNHFGELFGWEHALAGVGETALEPIGANWYRLRLKEGGAAKVSTNVHAIETNQDACPFCNGRGDPRAADGNHPPGAKVEPHQHCSYSTPASGSRTNLGGCLALGGLGLLLARRRQQVA